MLKFAIKWRWKLEKKARDLYYIIFCCKWWKKVWGLMSSKIWISWGKWRKNNLWLVAEGAASLHQVVLYDTNLTSNQVKMLFMIMQEFGNNQVWRPLHWLIGESHFAFGGKFYETAEVAHRYWTIISNQSTMHIVASCQHGQHVLKDINVKVCPTGSVGHQVLDDGLVQRARINVPHLHIFQHQAWHWFIFLEQFHYCRPLIFQICRFASNVKFCQTVHISIIFIW